MKTLLFLLISAVSCFAQGLLDDVAAMHRDVESELGRTIYISPTGNLSTALTQLVAGERLVLTEGHYENVAFYVVANGTPIRPITITAQGNVVVDCIDGVVIRGSDVVIEGIEFYTDSWTGDRFLTAQRFDFAIDGARCTIRNNIIHDFGNVGLWSDAPDSHFDGNLVYNIGRGNSSQGHTLYTQNADGTMFIRNNIFLVNYNSTFCLHQFGSGGARGLRGYRYDRNIFCNGRNLMGSPATKISDITFNNNVLIRGNIELGSLGASDPPHEFSLDGNKMWDAVFNIKKAGVLNLTHTLVTFPASTANGNIVNIAAGTIDYNRYRFHGPDPNQPYNRYNVNYVYGYGPNALGMIVNGTPFEDHSTEELYFGGTPPNEVDVNVYETTRANVAIANYNSSATVSVTLTGLENGEYRALNAQNTAEGFDFTYSGAAVTFPMTGWTNSVPIGTAGGVMVQYPILFPKFGIFKIIKKP